MKVKIGSKKKINKMSILSIRSKIKQLLKSHDKSVYLRHLILNAYERRPLEVVGWIKNFCRDFHFSKSEEVRYFWIIVQHQYRTNFNTVANYKEFLAFDNDELYTEMGIA